MTEPQTILEDALRGGQTWSRVLRRGQTLRLTQFWYDQKFIDGVADWKTGRITFEDFASFSCDFQKLPPLRRATRRSD